MTDALSFRDRCEQLVSARSSVFPEKLTELEAVMQQPSPEIHERGIVNLVNILRNKEKADYAIRLLRIIEKGVSLRPNLKRSNELVGGLASVMRGNGVGVSGQARAEAARLLSDFGPQAQQTLAALEAFKSKAPEPVLSKQGVEKFTRSPVPSARPA